MKKIQKDFKISIILLCYNQEKFIRQAVESLLQQNDSPLEIIFSDDYSQDFTYDILQECIHSYTGPHKIILNRNSENLSVLRHYNKVFSLTSGDWVVVAGGDDISYPYRCQEIRRAIQENPELLAVSSNVDIIDDEGNFRDLNTYITPLPPVGVKNIASHIKKSRYLPALLGGATAWSKKLLDQWLPLPENIYWEDLYLTFCLILSQGNYKKIDTPLLQYRKGRHNASSRSIIFDHNSSNASEAAHLFYKESENFFKETNKRVTLSCFSLENLIEDCLCGKKNYNIEQRQLIYLQKIIHTLGKSHQIASLWWEMPLWKKILNYPALCGLHRLGSFKQLAKLQSREAYIRGLIRQYRKTGKTSGLF